MNWNTTSIGSGDLIVELSGPIPPIDLQCSTGPGGISAASLDPMTPMEAWLNDGTRPASILAE